MNKSIDIAAGERWLVLVYQFPQGPGSARVKVWRRLQSIGAVAIKNSMYVLPYNDQSQEDFEWLLTELTGSGAEGAILEARLVNGMTDEQVRALFDAARSADYTELVEATQNTCVQLERDEDDTVDVLREARQTLARTRRKLAEVQAIDFFGAAGRDSAEMAIDALGRRIAAGAAPPKTPAESPAEPELQELKGRVWVTRRNVHVDRIACAWLIRRWIDPGATFRFVAGESYTPDDRELRFDMFEAEFTHQGDLCTFEVLVRMVAPGDEALRRVAEIVHDIDLKDGKFARAETQGIANLLTGLYAGVADDQQRIERGGTIFADLYRYYRGLDA